ncbi:portal protein [Fusobacterium varium]|uniref:portal protein n=1 Tax=Fusobacterium varium TaxID=856 RepID=UPI00241FDA41|nr:portal protein [Fusobacterium varium]
MALVTQEKLKQLYSQAQDYKGDIRESYNETFELTDPFFKIADSGKKESLERRKIDSTVLVSQRFLCNFIMTSLFSRSGSWAMLKTNPTAYKEINKADGEVAQDTIEALNKLMEKNSNIVYEVNETTNYYTETAKALMDSLRVGTGVRKTVVLASRSKPLTYEYINLDNFYYLEDSFGHPTITFKVHTEKTLSQLNDMFGHIKGWKKPDSLESEEDLKKTINVIESVIPDFKESDSTVTYYHTVHTEGFEEICLEEVLKYQPFRVFRWGTDSSNPWGIGIGRENTDLLKDLEDYKSKRNKHMDKIVNPPINWRGNIDLMYKASLEPGEINYAGDGLSGENDLGVQPINLGTNLLPVEQDIADARQRIREIYMAQPLGDVLDTKNRSATEMSLRHEMFRKEFSGAYELLNTELLQPTFMDAYIILQEKGLLDDYTTVDENTANNKYLEFSQIIYLNELTKSAGREEVMNAVSWYQINAELTEESRRKYLMNIPKFNRWSAEKMKVPLDLIPPTKEVEEAMKREDMIAQLTQLGQVQNEGLQPQVQEIAGGMNVGQQREI